MKIGGLVLYDGITMVFPCFPVSVQLDGKEVSDMRIIIKILIACFYMIFSLFSLL